MTEEKKEQLEQTPKTCPLLNKPCIGGECAWLVVLRSSNLGLMKQQGICGIPAISVILTMPQPQQQQFKMPPDLRFGKG